MTTTLEKPTVPQPIVEPTRFESLLPESLPYEEPTRRLWTRADYYKAGELGLFRPEERLELIDGEIWKKMSPQGAPHGLGVGLVADALHEAFPTGFHIREEKSLVLDDMTEPVPDVMVVRGTRRQTPGHATPANAVLVVEVSESSLKFDQTRKVEAYARSGVMDYWVLNQRARQLEVRRDLGLLDDGQWGYRSLQIIPEDGQVSPLAAPKVVINVADLLPSLPSAASAPLNNADAANTTDVQVDVSDTPQNE